MKATLFAVALLISTGPAYAQIFKCTNPDGSVSFASVPCVDSVGESEYVQPKVNQVGSLATESEINELRADRLNPDARRGTRVGVVYDSSDENQHTVDGVINRRLRLREEAANERLNQQLEYSNVVPDTSWESTAERAARLRGSAPARSAASPVLPQTPSTISPIEINTREVPYSLRQDPLERRIQQIQNKLNDPRPQDASRAHCSSSKPAFKVEEIRGEEIWPGMTGAQVTGLIGRPQSVNSVIVGQEQWIYPDGNKRWAIYVTGVCVSSIQ
ncbi:MAG: DUF4124 domain-containing protein [Pseudomonadaceae bacterium]